MPVNVEGLLRRFLRNKQTTHDEQSPFIDAVNGIFKSFLFLSLFLFFYARTCITRSYLLTRENILLHLLSTHQKRIVTITTIYSPETQRYNFYYLLTRNASLQLLLSTHQKRVVITTIYSPETRRYNYYLLTRNASLQLLSNHQKCIVTTTTIDSRGTHPRVAR